MNMNDAEFLSEHMRIAMDLGKEKEARDRAIDKAVKEDGLNEGMADMLHILVKALYGGLMAYQAAAFLGGIDEDDDPDGEDETFEDDSVPAPNVIVFDTDRHMKIIDIDECFAEVPWFGDSNVLIPVPEIEGLFLTCQKENLMCAGDKEYLIGQAVVMRVDENRDPLSVTLEDGMNVCRIMDQRMGVLVNDRTKEKKKAFCLS